MEKLKYDSRFDPKQIKRETIIRMVITGLISFSIVIALFYIGLKVFPYSIRLQSAAGEDELTKVDWSLLEGFSSFFTMCLVIGGLTFAAAEYYQSTVQQRRESAQASFSIYKEVYEKLMTPDATAARRWIILNLPVRHNQEDDQSWLQRTTAALNKCPEGWKGERRPGKDCLKEVLNTLDFLGFVAKHYWNMEDELVTWMSPSVAKVWERIYLYVNDEAKRRNEPDFYESAREFGQHCVEWRNKNYPKSNVIKDGT